MELELECERCDQQEGICEHQMGSKAGSEITPMNNKTAADWREKRITLDSKLRFIAAYDNSLCDVTFHVGTMKEKIRSHKLILSLASGVLENLIAQAEKDRIEAILVPDVEPKVFRKILFFLYTDDLILESSQQEHSSDFLLSLLEASRKFQIPLLEIYATKFLEMELTVENAISNLERVANEDFFEEYLFEFIIRNAAAVFDTDDFLNLSHFNLCKLLQNDKLQLDEMIIFEKSMSWAKEECKRQGLIENGEAIRLTLGQALYCIRFPLISLDDFLAHVIPLEILTLLEQLEIFKYTVLHESRGYRGFTEHFGFNCNPRLCSTTTFTTTSPDTATVAEKSQNQTNTEVSKEHTSLQHELITVNGQSEAGKPSDLSLKTTQPKIKEVAIQAKVEEPIKLPEAEKGYESCSEPRKNSDNVKDFKRNAVRILNTINHQNFYSLFNRFLQLPLYDIPNDKANEEKINAIAEIVFERVLHYNKTEPSHFDVYSKLILMTCQMPTCKIRKFRVEIVNHCQKEFQKSIANQDYVRNEVKNTAATVNGAMEENQMKFYLEKKNELRNKSLGNVRFIAELYKYRFLTTKIIVNCVNALLDCPTEVNVECLYDLLNAIGPRLEASIKVEQVTKSGSSSVAEYFNPEAAYMHKTFSKLQMLRQGNSLSLRIRLLLLNLVERREDGWKSRNPLQWLSISPPAKSNLPLRRSKKEKFQDEMKEKMSIIASLVTTKAEKENASKYLQEHVEQMGKIIGMRGKGREITLRNIIAMLQYHVIDNNNPGQICREIFQENSLEFRNELMAMIFMEAICSLAWTDKKEWDMAILRKMLPLLPLPNSKMFPFIWGQAKIYFRNHAISLHHEEELLAMMMKLDLLENKAVKLNK